MDFFLAHKTKGAEYGIISGRKMTCLTEAAWGSSQGHPYLRQVQTENKKLLFVSVRCLVAYLRMETDVFIAPKQQCCGSGSGIRDWVPF
jgi:hypothetical protein